MAKVEVGKSRAIINELPGGLEVVIPSKKKILPIV